MFCWHKWGMWSAPKNVEYIRHTETGKQYSELTTVQDRNCRKCGKHQFKVVDWK